MALKITDMVSWWQPKEEDLQPTLEEQSDQISVDRVKQLAMGGIKKQKHRYKKSYWILAAASLTMGLTVVAGTMKPVFQSFFASHGFILSPQLQEIEKSVIRHGVRATIESAVVDEMGALITFYLEKEDGTNFEDNMEVGEIHIDGLGGSSGSRIYRKLSEDKKKLMYSILLDTEESVYNQRLSLILNNMVTVEQGEKMLNTDLHTLYKKLPINKQINHTKGKEQYIEDEQLVSKKEAGLMWQPIQTLDTFWIDAVGFIDSNLIVQITLKKPIGGSSNRAYIKELKNIDNKELVYAHREHGTSSGEGENSFEINCYEYYLSDIEKLKKLQPVISYNLKEIVVQDSWEIPFRLEKNKHTIHKKIVVNKKDALNNTKLTDMYVSALGITLIGTSTNLYTQQSQIPNVDLDVKIKMKNGEIITCDATSMGMNEEEKLVLRMKKQDTFFDVDNIESIIIDENIYNINPLTK